MDRNDAKQRTVIAGALCLALVMILGACYEHTYTVGTGAPNGRIVYDRWHNHWLGGLISPEQEIKVREMCPSGNATIHEEVSFLNGLVSGLTSGIYAPTTVEVRCRGGGNSDLDFSADEVERLVLEPAFLEWIAARVPDLFEEAAAAQEALLTR